MRQLRSAVSDDTEEGRAFLQARVALFWKVLFFFFLIASGLGLVGAVKEPGLDLLLTLAIAAISGGCWWLCSRGQRSKRFSRVVETAGLLLVLSIGSFINRYVLAGFIGEHALMTSEGVLMADAFVCVLGQGGTALKMAIRAALVPSTPRRTVLLTGVLGIPLVFASTTLVPAGDGGLGGLEWRALDSAAYPWLPATAGMMWGFAIVTCAVISWIIYGLRAEVRQARRLGQYVLERKIGEGGMGEVYRAHHGMMRRPSALKLMRADRAGELRLQRFEREVQLTARLSHPNTITIFDYGRTHDGVFYYAMELLDGANLERVVELTGRQAPGRVVRILAMTCRALTEAHDIGLIHRDIKPANIMLCTQGGERDVVKVLDFGLVKELEVSGDARLTGANSVTGTPRYMAPECILAPESVDARTDLYALGAVAYFLLTGTDVFTGGSVLEVCSQHLHQQPEPLSARNVEVPGQLEAIILSCLEKDPSRRPSSAAELRRRLEACSVEPWSEERARDWWRDHQSELSRDLEQNEQVRTLAIDAFRTDDRVSAI